MMLDLRWMAPGDDRHGETVKFPKKHLRLALHCLAWVARHVPHEEAVTLYEIDARGGVCAVYERNGKRREMDG
jgi:hypothetical protein